MATGRKDRRRDEIDKLIERVRLEHVPDFRSGVFDVRPEVREGRIVLVGQSTDEDAVADLTARLRGQDVDVRDEVTRLPDPTFGARKHALARAAISPLYAEPRLPAPLISQLVLGMRVELLSRTDEWLRIRAEDGYVGWVHEGYVEEGSEEWSFAWERGTAGEPVVSLGAELVDEEGHRIIRLPWGARLARHSGGYVLPDGRRGVVAEGELVDVDRLADWFPLRGESVARTARRWVGSPYLWGGVTPSGVDCSGFAQAVMWVHGVALPRDSDLQQRTGNPVETTAGFGELHAGDLLYFADPGERVSHVAISLGGPIIIHSALANGGVEINDLTGALPFEKKLARLYVGARRMLSD